jgi:peptidoglycan/LPS O-acetylase OafA/YrhL
MNIVTYRLTLVVLGLFVLVSGYLIGSKDVAPNKNDIIAFYRARILRIYPPFIAAIVLFYVLKISHGTALAKSAALVSLFFPPAPPTLWFVTMIAVYYIIAPLLINMSSNYSISQYALFCLIMITAAYYIFGNAIDIRCAMYLPAFAAGVLMARQSALVYKLNLAVVVLLLIVSLIISFNGIAPVESNILSTPLVLFGTLLVFAFFMRMEKRTVQYKTLRG